MGSREIPFTREVYIDRADFRETANKKYKRMVTGGEVRLRNGYVIKCEQVIKDEAGEVISLEHSAKQLSSAHKVGLARKFVQSAGPDADC